MVMCGSRFMDACIVCLCAGAAAGLYGAGSNGGGGSAHLQMDANASATCWDVGSNAAMANDRSFMQLLQVID